MLICVFIVLVAVYAIYKCKSSKDKDVGYQDDPEDNRSKKRILIGSDIKHAEPIGPGECGINDDVS